MPKAYFDHIAVIFNPISTGNAPAMASSIVKQIEELAITEPTLTPTKYAGHAQELAEKIALKYKRPLIVSVSGDGGYNEIVNGAMRAKEKSKSAQPVITVVGAGNANDHRRVMRDKDTSVVSLIKKATPKPIDLILLEVTASRYSLKRYAHSYIGLGISPEVAVQLNKHNLTTLQEIRIVLKAFLRYKPFTIEQDKKTREVDSLIFANINEMAKVLKLHHKRTVCDSKFEVIEFEHRGKFWLLYMMMVAAFRGLRNQPHSDHYAFKMFDTHPIQLDGEVEKLPRRSSVTVTCVPGAIESLY